MPKRRLLNISRPNADNSSPHSQSNESITQLQSQHDIDLDSQTASRSLSNLEEQDGPQLCSGQRKRTRGPTRMADVWELNKGEQVIIQINERGQLVGDGSSVLSQFTGTIARMSHLAPINCLSWYKMPKANKDEIWNIIEELMKKGMNDPGTSQGLKDYHSWKTDVYSQIKGPDKRCRVRCVGKLPTSKKSCSLSSTDVHYQRQKLLKEEISNLKETVTSLLTILQKRFPEDVANVLREASHPREVPDANSAPDPSSRGDISSSSSNHQS